MISRRGFLAGLAGVAVVPQAVAAGPVLFPTMAHEGQCAMPYSGGLLRDDRGNLRLYYLADFRLLCLAVSADDGLTWRKPDLGDGTNAVLRPDGPVDAISVCRSDAGQYCAMVTSPGLGRIRFYTSDDGIAWQRHTIEHVGGDRSSLGFFRGRFLFFVRTGGGTGGDPRRFDLVESVTFPPRRWERREWLRADAADGESSQLYGVDLVGGSFGNKLALTIWRGAEEGRPKLNDVCLGLLRDDLTVLRDYDPVAMPGPAGSWNYGNVQGVAGGSFQAASGRWKLIVSGRSGNAAGGNGICATGLVTV